MSQSTRRSCHCAICKQDAHETEFNTQLLVADEDHLSLQIHSRHNEVNNCDCVLCVGGGDVVLAMKGAASLQFPKHLRGQGAVAFGAASRPYHQLLDNHTSSGTSSSKSAPVSEFNQRIHTSSPQTLPAPLAVQYAIQKGKRITTSRSTPTLGLCDVPTSSSSTPKWKSTPFSPFNSLIHFHQRVASMRNPCVPVIPLVIPQAVQQTESVTTSRSAPTPEIPRFLTSSLNSPIQRSASVASSRSAPGFSLHDIPPSSSSPPIYFRGRVASMFTRPIQSSNPPCTTHSAVVIPEATQQSESASRSAPVAEIPSSPARRRSASVTSSRSAPGFSLHGIPPSSSSLPICCSGRATYTSVLTRPIQSSDTPCASTSVFHGVLTSTSTPLTQQTASVTSSRSASASPPYGTPFSTSSSPIHCPGEVASAQTARVTTNGSVSASDLHTFPTPLTPVQQSSSIASDRGASVPSLHDISVPGSASAPPSHQSSPHIKKTSSITSSRGSAAFNRHFLPSHTTLSVIRAHASDPPFKRPRSSKSSRSASTSSPDILAPQSGLTVYPLKSVALPHIPFQRARSTQSRRSVPISSHRPLPPPGAPSSNSSSQIAISSTNGGRATFYRHRSSISGAFSTHSSARRVRRHKPQSQDSPATKISRISAHRSVAKTCSDCGRADGRATSQELQSLGGVGSASTSHLRKKTPKQNRPKALMHQDFITSPHLINVVDAVVEKYESNAVELPELPSLPEATPSPFLTLSPEALEHHFEVTIDAKNALLLRQLTTLTDMGISLEMLTSQLCLYDKDAARLVGLKDELELLMQANSDRGLDLDFDILENFRSSFPPYKPSFTEKNRLLYCNVQPLIDARRDAQAAGLCFLKDPMSLREYRLPLLSTSQR